jgi:hypothetical protein
VYLAFDIGAEVNLTSIPVHLLTDVLLIDTLYAPACERRNQALAEASREAEGLDAETAEQRIRARWREATDQAWRERAQILQELVLRRTETDRQAAFAFDSVPPGSYRLWADAVVGEDRWTWLTRVRVRAGDTVRVNLSNANADNALRCP